MFTLDKLNETVKLICEIENLKRENENLSFKLFRLISSNLIDDYVINNPEKIRVKNFKANYRNEDDILLDISLEFEIDNFKFEVNINNNYVKYAIYNKEDLVNDKNTFETRFKEYLNVNSKLVKYFKDIVKNLYENHGIKELDIDITSLKRELNVLKGKNKFFTKVINTLKEKVK